MPMPRKYKTMEDKREHQNEYMKQYMRKYLEKKRIEKKELDELQLKIHKIKGVIFGIKKLGKGLKQIKRILYNNDDDDNDS